MNNQSLYNDVLTYFEGNGSLFRGLLNPSNGLSLLLAIDPVEDLTSMASGASSLRSVEMEARLLDSFKLGSGLRSNTGAN